MRKYSYSSIPEDDAEKIVCDAVSIMRGYTQLHRLILEFLNFKAGGLEYFGRINRLMENNEVELIVNTTDERTGNIHIFVIGIDEYKEQSLWIIKERIMGMNLGDE